MIGRLKRVAASDLLLRRTAFSESMRRHVESNSDKLSAANFYIAIKISVMKEISLNTVEGM